MVTDRSLFSGNFCISEPFLAVALSRKSLKGGQFTLKNAWEGPGLVSQDRKSSRTGGRPTSFYCTSLHVALPVDDSHTAPLIQIAGPFNSEFLASFSSVNE